MTPMTKNIILNYEKIVNYSHFNVECNSCKSANYHI